MPLKVLLLLFLLLLLLLLVLVLVLVLLQPLCPDALPLAVGRGRRILLREFVLNTSKHRKIAIVAPHGTPKANPQS